MSNAQPEIAFVTINDLKTCPIVELESFGDIPSVFSDHLLLLDEIIFPPIGEMTVDNVSKYFEKIQKTLLDQESSDYQERYEELYVAVERRMLNFIFAMVYLQEKDLEYDSYIEAVRKAAEERRREQNSKDNVSISSEVDETKATS